MKQFDHTHLKLISEGIRLFNAQKYWECHEELEPYWLEEEGAIRNIYWAIIQVAAAMIHFREGNIAGARSLIIKAKQKIDRCEEFLIESKLLEEKLSWIELKKLVRAGSLQTLYEFRFLKVDING